MSEWLYPGITGVDVDWGQRSCETVISDEERWSRWMARAQRGDEQAYRELLAELGEVIAAYLYSRFGRLEMTEECVQECLISIHFARHTYDQARPFRPWLFALVRNQAIDMLRSQNRYRVMIDQRSQYREGQKSLEDVVGKDSIFAALAPNHREALLLTKVVGLSVAEVAKKLNLSESAVKVRVHRAIHASRKLLEAE